MDRCHLNVILHFLSICLMVASMVFLQIVHAEEGRLSKQQHPVTELMLVCGMGTAEHCPSHAPELTVPDSVMGACLSFEFLLLNLVIFCWKSFKQAFRSVFPTLERDGSAHTFLTVLLANLGLPCCPATAGDVLLVTLMQSPSLTVRVTFPGTKIFS